MTTAIPYNLKANATRLPAGTDPTLRAPAPLVNPLLQAANSAKWSKADATPGATFPADSVQASATHPATRKLPAFVWPKVPAPSGPGPFLDPDIALWPMVIPSIWPFAGHPSTGVWPKGWFGVDSTATMYICTVGGSPGTWAVVGSGGGGGTLASPLKISNTDDSHLVQFWFGSSINDEVTGAQVSDLFYDYVNSTLYVCTVAGTPGTWVNYLAYQPVRVVTTSYSPIEADVGKVIEVNNASLTTFTLPHGVFQPNTEFEVCQVGAGGIQFASDGTSVVESLNGDLQSAGQWASITVRWRSTTQCVLAGALAP